MSCAPATSSPSRPTCPSSASRRRSCFRIAPRPRRIRASRPTTSAGGPASTSATGSSSAATYPTVQIAVDAGDDELIAEIIRVTHELFGIELTLAPDRQRLTGRGTAALAEFVELNGLGGTALTKRIPDWVFGLPRSPAPRLPRRVRRRRRLRTRQLGEPRRLAHEWRTPTSSPTPRNFCPLCGIGSGSVNRFASRHPLDAERTIVGIPPPAERPLRPSALPFSAPPGPDEPPEVLARLPLGEGHDVPSPHE